MRIAIVAGEASGDLLGAGLIRALKTLSEDLTFFGVGGDQMIAEGFVSLYPMERLSIMGLVEPLKRLPELLRMRKHILDTCKAEQIDLFIGIDSPDFNLGIEKRLKKAGIKTCHYVSPSVWAWRQGRIRGIKASVDLMLTLLPFEADFYKKHQVPVAFVGHPLADEIPFEPDQQAAREKLGIDKDVPVLAVLPGSRGGEVRLLGELFFKVIAQVAEQLPECIFLIPAANSERLAQLDAILNRCPSKLQRQIRLIEGQSLDVMTASDTVLLASGTTALEAMLLKKPMVVAYKIAPLSYAIVSRLIRTEFVSLPNLLAGREVVPELLQDEATREALTDKVLPLMTQTTVRNAQIEVFKRLHGSIQRDANSIAAQAVWDLLND